MVGPFRGMAHDCRMMTRKFALNSTNAAFHASNLCQEVKYHNLNINTILNTTLTRKEGCYDANPVVSLLQLNTQHTSINLCVGRLSTPPRYRYTSLCCYDVLNDVFTPIKQHTCQVMCTVRNCKGHRLPWEDDGYSADLIWSNILWKPKVYYRVYNTLPPVRVLSDDSSSPPLSYLK
jgi:hypothetical protein